MTTSRARLDVGAPPSGVTEAIVAAVERARDLQLETLVSWVGTDSPTEEKGLVDAMGQRIIAEAESIGMEVSTVSQERYGDHILARVGQEATAGPRVMLVGHFDTVYPAGTAAARGFRIDGDRGLGPGALDMKGGVVVGLYALRALRESLGSVPLPVTFLFNSEEEVGSPTSRVPLTQEAPLHDLVVVLEPGKPGPAVVLQRKGVGIVHLVVEGVEAHAGAEPEKGASAIVAMASHVQELVALQHLAIGTTVTPGRIEGGTHPYVVPGRCTLGVDMRVPTASEQARLETALERLVEQVPVPRTRTSMSGGFHRPPMEPSDGTWAAFEGLRASANAIGYGPLGHAATGGASDGNLTAALGVPTLDGMGTVGGRAHSTDEYIELESLFEKTKLLATYLAALANVREVPR
jgi:glutamate carboxypeptidase